MAFSPDPQSLIIQPAVDARVGRAADGRLTLAWTPTAKRLTVFAGDDPERINRNDPLLVVDEPEALATRSVSLPPVGDMARPYFELHFAGNPDGERHYLVAERALPLERGTNFRDIGGYATRDSRTTRWGRLYRSGLMSELTPDDLAYLKQLDLQLVCDLRSDLETEYRPDRLPAGATYWHRPIVYHNGHFGRFFTLFRKRNRLQEVLLQVYTHLVIDKNPDLIGDLFRRAADPANLPLLIHCTAGKDRTGMVVAMLLAALGVPDDTIIADYSLSNEAYPILAARSDEDMGDLKRLRFSNQQLHSFLLAEPRTMQAALSHVRGRYGSVREYLSRMAGVTPEIIEQVSDNLLA